MTCKYLLFSVSNFSKIKIPLSMACDSITLRSKTREKQYGNLSGCVPYKF